MKRLMMLAATAAIAAGLGSLSYGTGAVAGSHGQGQVNGPKSDTEIRQSLQADGYTIQRMERERNKVEVKATRDSQRWELKVDAQTGTILQRELDD
jgi:hypothetical protein